MQRRATAAGLLPRAATRRRSGPAGRPLGGPSVPSEEANRPEPPVWGSGRRAAVAVPARRPSAIWVVASTSSDSSSSAPSRVRTIRNSSTSNVRTIASNGRRIHVDAPEQDEVVRATDQAAGEGQEAAPAGTRAPAPPDQVSSAVPDDRPGGAPKVGEDELSHLALAGRPAGGVDHLGDELGLVDVERGLRFAGIGVGADLGGAGVVEAPGTPALLDPGPDLGNRRAGFTCVDRDANRGGCQVTPSRRATFSRCRA